MISRRKNRNLSNVELGALGELYARKYLRRKGLRLLEANWRCALGELDIVAKDKRELVFVEVKTRFEARNVRSLLLSNVTEEKQRRIRRLVEMYLRYHYPGRMQPAVRIDVIGVIVNKENFRLKAIDHLLGAI